MVNLVSWAWRLMLRSPWPLGALLTVALQLGEWNPIHRLDLVLFDLVAPASRTPVIEDATVVAIDDASLAELGAWPWSRRVHGAMIDRLREAGASVIVYDVLFSEPSFNDPAADEELAAALRRSGRVALPVAPAPAPAPAPASPKALPGIVTLAPLPVLAESARSLGHVDVEVDADAISRRVYLEAGDGAARWPALPLAAWAIERESALPHFPGRRAPAPATGRKATWFRDYEVLVPHSAATMPQVSFAQVLRDPVAAGWLKGKVAFVGVTATGLGPSITTTIATSRSPMPAVQFHAWTYVALRAGTLITPLGIGASMALVLPVFLILLAWAPRFRRSRSILVGLASAVPIILSVLLLRAGDAWFAPLSTTLGLALGNLLWRGNHLREAGQQLFRAQQQAQATLHAIADGVITVNARQEVRYANPVARQLAGREELDGMPAADLFAEDPPHRQLVQMALGTCMTQKEAVRVQTDLALSSPAGGTRLVRLTATPLLDLKGNLEGAVLAMSDVTEAAEAAARLDHAATHDALTGLPNRVLFHDRLRQAIAESKRSGDSAAVLFMDLDRFKRINDSLGHRLGDHVLKVIADRLRTNGRANDTVARWGGDEFVILLNGLNARDAIALATKRLMEAVAETIQIDGIDLQCSCSVGIALVPQDTSDADTLLAMADMAMYRGRAKSGGRFDFYSSEMSLWTRDRLELETGLRQALTEREFELHYQPQIDLRTGQPVALEALLRWRKTAGEVLLPDRFIGVAEESGLILEIGEWVIFEAAGQIARWEAAGLPVLPVAVNVSARQCLDHGIVRILREALDRTAIRPQLLMLEITETTAMRDVEHVVDLLKQISALGVGIAVDDFGTGYSSLSYLKRFPINQLKIDQSFVRDITTDQNDAAIVGAIIALAHSLGLPVVAEGVETETQRAFLAGQHCDLAQGYLFSAPLQADGLIETLRSRALSHPA